MHRATTPTPTPTICQQHRTRRAVSHRKCMQYIVHRTPMQGVRWLDAKVHAETTETRSGQCVASTIRVDSGCFFCIIALRIARVRYISPVESCPLHQLDMCHVSSEQQEHALILDMCVQIITYVMDYRYIEWIILFSNQLHSGCSYRT